MTSNSDRFETIDTTDVEWAYRIFLGRAPASPEVCQKMARSLQTRSKLRARMLQTPEFSKPGAARRRQSIKIDPEYREWAEKLILIDQPLPESEYLGYSNLDQLVHRFIAAEGLLEGGDEVTILLSKSMPRSGHHFLAQLLQEYFGPDLRFCKFYKEPNCCQEIPCSRPQDPNIKNRFLLQKGHDLRLKDKIDNNQRFVIQYRHPIPRSQSNFELKIQRGALDDTRKDFEKFLEEETEYFIRFYNKWIESPPPVSIVISYEELASDPKATLRRVVEFAAPGEINEERLSSAAKTGSSINAHTGQSFKPRAIENHRYYDESLCKQIEDRAFSNCPGLALPRYFD